MQEIVLTVDTLGLDPAAAGDECDALQALADAHRNAAPQFVVRFADYSPARRHEVSARVFCRGLAPKQTYRVGPFHAYFDGWLATAQPYIFHLDSDMFIGGSAHGWMAEAIALLQRDASVFTCTPLAGPPRADLSVAQPSRREAKPRGAHAFDTFSTRIFFAARERLLAPDPRLPLQRAHWRGQFRGWFERTSPYALPEDIIGGQMQRLRQRRVDFLGEPPGCWSLHPPYRNAEFYDRLDELVQRVERDEFPEGQRGDYDVNDSVIDWSDARAIIAHNRWWKRGRAGR